MEYIKLEPSVAKEIAEAHGFESVIVVGIYPNKNGGLASYGKGPGIDEEAYKRAIEIGRICDLNVSEKNFELVRD